MIHILHGDDESRALTSSGHECLRQFGDAASIEFDPQKQVFSLGGLCYWTSEMNITGTLPEAGNLKLITTRPLPEKTCAAI